MKTMTITGVTVQVDVLDDGDLEEAKVALQSMNVACGNLDGQPQVMLIDELTEEQFQVEDDGEDD